MFGLAGLVDHPSLGVLVHQKVRTHFIHESRIEGSCVSVRRLFSFSYCCCWRVLRAQKKL
jgi:hypothetical protein